MISDITDFFKFVFLRLMAGPLFGYGMGRFAVFWVQNILHDTALEIVVVVSLAFLTAEMG